MATKKKNQKPLTENNKKKLFAIFIKALKKHNILSSAELKQISQLEIF